MSSIVIQVNGNEDIRLLEQLATRLGLTYYRIDEAEQRRLAKASLVEVVVKEYQQNVETPEELISQTIEAIRSKRYDNQENKGNH